MIPYISLIGILGLALAILAYSRIWIIASRPILISPIGQHTQIGGSADGRIYQNYTILLEESALRLHQRLAYIGWIAMGFAFTYWIGWSITVASQPEPILLILILITLSIIALVVGVSTFPLADRLTKKLLSATRIKRQLQPFYCQRCHQPLQELNGSTLKFYLSHSAQIAQEKGIVSFVGWRCPQCQPQLSPPGINLYQVWLKPPDEKWRKH